MNTRKVVKPTNKTSVVNSPMSHPSLSKISLFFQPLCKLFLFPLSPAKKILCVIILPLGKNFGGRVLTPSQLNNPSTKSKSLDVLSINPLKKLLHFFPLLATRLVLEKFCIKSLEIRISKNKVIKNKVSFFAQN